MTHDELRNIEERLGNMIEERMSAVKDMRRRTFYGVIGLLTMIGSWWIGNINGRVRDIELESARAKQETIEIQKSMYRVETKVDALIQKEFPGRN